MALARGVGRSEHMCKCWSGLRKEPRPLQSAKYRSLLLRAGHSKSELTRVLAAWGRALARPVNVLAKTALGPKWCGPT
eukprot:3393993-Alexandrium_andersonii.AAC.1